MFMLSMRTNTRGIRCCVLDPPLQRTPQNESFQILGRDLEKRNLEASYDLHKTALAVFGFTQPANVLGVTPIGWNAVLMLWLLTFVLHMLTFLHCSDELGWVVPAKKKESRDVHQN